MVESTTMTGHIDCILSANQIAPSPPSATALTFFGSPVALQKKLGIDSVGLQAQGEGAQGDALGADGELWHLTWRNPCVHAWRERTAVELELWNDELNSRSLCSWFGSDRLKACQMIAGEMLKLCWSMKPEASVPRSQRRAVKRRLDVLGEVQYELTTCRDVDMRSVRNRLGAIGIVIHQRTHHEEVQHG